MLQPLGKAIDFIHLYENPLSQLKLNVKLETMIIDVFCSNSLMIDCYFDIYCMKNNVNYYYYFRIDICVSRTIF